MTIRTEAPALKPAGRSADLIDVVVVGGGGHVGLPLALSLANTGMRVGIQDVSATTVARIQAGETPFIETGLDELLRHELDAGRLEITTDPAILARTRIVILVIGTPVDEFLNPVMTVFERALKDLAPHLRCRILVVLRSTVFPGHDRVRPQDAGQPGSRGRCRLLPRADRRGPRARGAADACPRSWARTTTAAGDRAAAFFRAAGREHRPDGHTRGRAGQAAHQHLALHEVRHRQPVLRRSPSQPGSTTRRSTTRSRRTTRGPPTCPVPASPPGPCLLKDTMQLAAFTPDHFPIGQAAMQINEGLPAFLVDSLKRRYGVAARARPSASSAWPSRPSPTTSARRSATSCASCWRGRGRASSAPTRTWPIPSSCRSRRSCASSDLFVMGAPHRRYRGLDVGGRPVVDVWGIVAGAHHALT